MSSPRAVGSSDPGDHLDRRRRESTHRAAVDTLLLQYTEWMRTRCRIAAIRHDLDPDDVFQLTLERLLRSSRTADLTDDGLLTWLARRIDWAAGDLIRKHGRDGGERPGDDAIATLLDIAASPAHEIETEEEIDPALLRRAGLNENQVQILLIVCSGLDLPLRQVAHLVGRSPAAVRKDKQRAIDRIERWLALDPEERLVLAAFRETRSVSEGARRTGHPPAEFRRLLDAGSRKVNGAFTESGVDSDVS